jgi:hypothetical protein
VSHSVEDTNSTAAVGAQQRSPANGPAGGVRTSLPHEIYESFAGPMAKTMPLETLEPLVRRQYELMAKRRASAQTYTPSEAEREISERQGDLIDMFRREI